MSGHWKWTLDGQSQFQRTPLEEQPYCTTNFPPETQRMLNFSSGSRRTAAMNSADPESIFSTEIMAGFPRNQLMKSLNIQPQYSRNYYPDSQVTALTNMMDVQHHHSAYCPSGSQNTISTQSHYAENFSPSSHIYTNMMDAHSRHSTNIPSGAERMFNSRYLQSQSATNIPSGFQRDTLSNVMDAQPQYPTHFTSSSHRMLNSVLTESQHPLNIPSSNSQRNDCNSLMNLPSCYLQNSRPIQTDDHPLHSHKSPYIFQNNFYGDLMYKEPQRIANVIPFFLRETSMANSMESQVQHSLNYPTGSKETADTNSLDTKLQVQNLRLNSLIDVFQV